MPSANVLTFSPFNIGDIPLGGIVIDAKYPHQDSIGGTTARENISVAIDENLTGNAQHESNTSLQWLTSMIMSIFWKVESEDNFGVQTDEARIYQVLEPRAIFEELCAREETQQWLYRSYRDQEKPLFVVGYRTLLNARVVRRFHDDSSMMGRIQVPSAALVTGLPDTDATRLEASATHHDRSNRTLQFAAQGERIFAICYRRINFRFHNNVLDASLQRKNFWRSSNNRGNAPGSDQLMEAVLDDDSDWTDDEECTKTQVGDAMFVSLPKEDED